MAAWLRSRTTWTTATALAVHLAVAAALRAAAIAPAPSPPSPLPLEDVAEIDVVALAPPEEVAPDLGATRAPGAAVAAATRATRETDTADHARGAARAGDDVATTETGSDVFGGGGGRGDAEEAPPLRTGAVDLSLRPADRVALVEKSLGDAPAPPSALVDPATRPVADSRGGPILAAVEAAAHGAAAPAFGVATFDIAVRKDGSVSVSLSEASTNWNGWASLRPTIQRSVAEKPVRMPPNGRGIRVVVRVEAAARFPGGAEPVPEDKQGLEAHASIGKITDAKSGVTIEPPHVSLAYRSRSCGVGVKITPSGIGGGGGCAAGVEMRVVEARIVGEGLL